MHDVKDEDDEAKGEEELPGGDEEAFPKRCAGLGCKIGAAGGTQAAGAGDFVSAVIAVVNGLHLGVACDGEGEEDEAEGPEGN